MTCPPQCPGRRLKNCYPQKASLCDYPGTCVHSDDTPMRSIYTFGGASPMGLELGCPPQSGQSSSKPTGEDTHGLLALRTCLLPSWVGRWMCMVPIQGLRFRGGVGYSRMDSEISLKGEGVFHGQGCLTLGKISEPIQG